MLHSSRNVQTQWFAALTYTSSSAAAYGAESSPSKSTRWRATATTPSLRVKSRLTTSCFMIVRRHSNMQTLLFSAFLMLFKHIKRAPTQPEFTISAVARSFTTRLCKICAGKCDEHAKRLGNADMTHTRNACTTLSSFCSISSLEKVLMILQSKITSQYKTHFHNQTHTC